MKYAALIIVLLSHSFIQARTHRINIQDAVSQKKIKADVTSKGGHQGYCLNLSLQNLTADSLEVLVEAGRRFVAGDPGDQDILIVKQERILMRKGQGLTKQLKGYCCQASDRSPSAHARYTIGPLADSALYMLAQHLNAHSFDSDIEQQAIWAISDNKSTSTIPAGKDSCALELRRLVASLKREPIPWCIVDVRNRQFSNGVIEQYTTRVSGILQFSTNDKVYGTFSVLDSAGTEVAFIKSEWLNAGSNQDYKFSVPVGGLKKGRYFVQIASPNATLVKRSFEI